MTDDDVEKAPGFRQKLVESKKSWAQEGRLLTGQSGTPQAMRLPPGQRLVESWPVLDLGIQPAINLEDWRLVVDGLVEQPQSWDWAAFQAQPQVTSISDMHCVTQWSRYDNEWTGVTTRHIMDMAGLASTVSHVILYSHDGYTTNLPLDAFAGADCLVAHRHDGVPLTREHGGPARLIVPQLYLWKSAKWLQRIEFASKDHPGFWEVRGYHNEGDPWQEQRYA